MDISLFFQSIKIPMTVLHVLAVVFGMGGALISDILFTFFSKDKKLNSTEIFTLSILSKVVFYGLIFIILSGIAIFLSDVIRYLNSPKFLAKMSILLVLLVNGYFLKKYIWPHLLKKGFLVFKKERNVRRLAFASGAISVVSWLSAFTLGVLNKVNASYIFIMSLYLVILVFGIIIALLVEKRVLN